MIKFSIVITTKNRLGDLKTTLKSLDDLINRNDVELLICDDFSIDNTQDFLKKEYNKHTLLFNSKNLGLIHNRNILNNLAKGDYIISLDDDANFLSQNVLENIEEYFFKNKNCGVISCRIFWGTNLPKNTITKEKNKRVKGFVGCGHIWRKTSWESIPKYPSWFKFYGEEDFASYQLFKKNIEIHYVPNILVHHRVNLKSRKNNKDYYLRQRRSLRAGWYLFFMFYPKRTIFKRLLSSLYNQIKNKVLRGDFKILWIIFLAKLDVIFNIPNLFLNRNRLTIKEFKEFEELSVTEIYWSTKKEI